MEKAIRRTMLRAPLPARPRVLKPTKGALQEAAEALSRGELVVFPTETVYGVGANALDPKAVRGIFDAKGRPADNPVILHAADEAHARALVRVWPRKADRLAHAFWPGPLTLVLPRHQKVPDAATAGLDTVAVRVPDDPIVRRLLALVDFPLAAPSANRSGRPSPTRVGDAVDDLGAKVALYLDGGRTRVGLESTVVAVVGDRCELLRPGAIPVEAIERIVGPMGIAGDGPGPARSPGQRHRHYAPEARVEIVEASRLAGAAAEAQAGGRRVALVVSVEAGLEGRDVFVLGSRRRPDVWAHGLFALLRDLDAQGYDLLLVEPLAERGLGTAVMDRLRRAAEAHAPTKP